MKDLRLKIGPAALATSVTLLSCSAYAHPLNKFGGTASYYSTGYKGRVASGDRYDPEKFTAAHKTLPFGTRVRVNCRKTGRSVTVIINDRGPFSPGRVLDLSYAAAQALHMIGRGLVKVEAQVE